MFDCFWLSVPVQLIAWKDLSPKWPVMWYTLHVQSLTAKPIRNSRPIPVIYVLRLWSYQIKIQIRCSFINRLDITQANNCGRTCVKQELVSVFVQQAYQKITVRQLSLMLRQLQWVSSLSKVVSLWRGGWLRQQSVQYVVRPKTSLAE